MPINITMPALSPTMEEGNLAKWLVKEGDKVSPGDVIAEIETDKATMEVEAVDEGTVAKLVVPAGTEGVKVNAVIAARMRRPRRRAARLCLRRLNRQRLRPSMKRLQSPPVWGRCRRSRQRGALSRQRLRPSRPPLPCRASPPQGGRMANRAPSPHRWHGASPGMPAWTFRPSRARDRMAAWLRQMSRRRSPAAVRRRRFPLLPRRPVCLLQRLLPPSRCPTRLF